MRRERRLRKSREFAAVRRGGRSWVDRVLVLVARRNGLSKSRFGFVVGRGVGNAVVRNRVKRRLRALASDSAVAEGWDLVVIARKQAAESPSQTLNESLLDLMTRAGVLRKTDQTAENTRGPK